jgi:hypothetical protein
MGFFATMLGQQAHWWVPARRTVVCLPLQAGAFSVANQGTTVLYQKMVLKFVKNVQREGLPPITTLIFRVNHVVVIIFLRLLVFLVVQIVTATCSVALVNHNARCAPLVNSWSIVH